MIWNSAAEKGGRIEAGREDEKRMMEEVKDNLKRDEKRSETESNPAGRARETLHEERERERECGGALLAWSKSFHWKI